nr:hypothetical protein [Tanacetum cinerariifolium]
MASTYPPLISDPRNQKWVGEISEILHQQLNVNIRPAVVSIFQVPETITTEKPEAYEPQLIALGPYHHFRPLPYKKMEQKKLVSVQRVLDYHEYLNFDISVLKEVRKLVPFVRASYDTFLEYDNVSMAWVFSIDALFLLYLLHPYDKERSDTIEINVSGESSSPQSLLKHPTLVDDQTKRSLAQDIMMVENQIPFIVLNKVNEAIHPWENNKFLGDVFRCFSEFHSPLELCSESDAPKQIEHLLHYMYHSITKVPTKSLLTPHDPTGPSSSSSHHKLPDPSLSINMVNSTGQHSESAKKVFKNEIVQMYEQAITILQNFSTSKVSIPSASKLLSKADFSFYPLPEHDGVNEIDIKDMKFFLPVMTLNNDSEVILRNLVSYEILVANSDRFPLTEYVSLMCGLISNVDDVKLLKEKEIIKGDLGDKEVAKLFVGMRSCIPRRKTKEKSKLQREIEEVNKVYETTRMKASLVLQKLAQKVANWLLVILTAIDGFVRDRWMGVTLLITIVTGLPFIYQAYRSIVGCNKINVMPLSHASS